MTQVKSNLSNRFEKTFDAKAVDQIHKLFRFELGTIVYHKSIEAKFKEQLDSIAYGGMDSNAIPFYINNRTYSEGEFGNKEIIYLVKSQMTSIVQLHENEIMSEGAYLEMKIYYTDIATKRHDAAMKKKKRSP